MTSFLTNMIDRSLGSTAAVQPRIRPLFEPPVSNTDEHFEQPASSTAVTPSINNPFTQQQAPLNPRREPEQVVPPHVERGAVPTLSSRVEAVSESPNRSVQLPAQLTPARQANAAHEFPKAVPETVEKSTLSVHEATQEARAFEEPPPPTLQIPKHEVSPTPVVTPLRPINESTDKPSSPAAETGPIVQIRIGRIEVRAVTTPEPSKPAAAPKQKLSLSLDDYMKQRGGDQR